MSSKTLLTVLLFSSTICFIVGAPTCPSDWEYYMKTNACYFSSEYSATFTQAVDSCKKMDSTLVSIHSADENQFLSSSFYKFQLKTPLELAEDHNVIWIGVELQNENGYQNVDGSKMDFENFLGSDDGDNDCVQSNVNSTWGSLSNGWETRACSDYLSYVCKKSLS